VVDRALAQELGLRKVGETRIGDPANPQAIAADIVTIDSLRVGGVAFEGLRAASWDRSAQQHRMPNPPRGVIGFAVWRELLLTLDYPGTQVRVARGKLPEADGRAVLAYTDDDGIPSIPVQVAGVPLVAHLDTGSPGFVSIPAADTARVHFDGPLHVMGRGRTVNSEMLFRGGLLAGAVAIGAYTFDHPVVMVNDVLPNANVGGRALRDFVLTFDQPARRMRVLRTRVSPPEAFAPPVRPPGAAGSPPLPGSPPAPGSAPGAAPPPDRPH
jgi:hypothetical protein